MYVTGLPSPSVTQNLHLSRGFTNKDPFLPANDLSLITFNIKQLNKYFYTYNKGKQVGICHLTSAFHNHFWLSLHLMLKASLCMYVKFRLLPKILSQGFLLLLCNMKS